MDMMQAVYERHSVRSYIDRAVEKEKLDVLRKLIEECNADEALNIQLVTNEPRAFSVFLTHYGLFDNIKNYIVLAGGGSDDIQEKCGYHGERLVLTAQALGLNTCWVALTYKKVPGAFTLREGDKLICVIALGYGRTQGKAHRSKPLSAVIEGGNHPEWFIRGAECALLAPTAVNQQKFRFVREGSKVRAVCGLGACAKIDLGIVKYHFELGAGKENFEWM